MGRRHKPNSYALRTGFNQVAPPGEPVTIHTDPTGDSLVISASGRGLLLVEILPADETRAGLSVEMPEHKVLDLVGAAVRATKKTPEQLKREYNSHRGKED